MTALAYALARYQDCFTHGYYLFGKKVASNAVSATSFTSVLSQVVSLEHGTNCFT